MNNESNVSHIRALYDAVQRRPRPEDVAELVLEAIGSELKKSDRAILEKAARHSTKRSVWGYSSMATDFARPVSHVDKQVKIAADLFGVETMTAEACLDANRVEAFVRNVSEKIQKVYGRNNFRGDRLNREQRKQAGIFKCQRWYNKRWRILARMEEKLQKLVWNQRKYLFTRVGKSALAINIPFEDFAADVRTACLVAYLTARMSMRSVFTNQSQERAYDEVSDMLFEHARKSGTLRYDVAAYVMPDERVLAKLTNEQKGKMLGTWWALLVDMGDMLHECHRTAHFSREDMIVQRGNDSSTWNQVAGGWNQARGHWISLVHALGMESMLDTVCPGKVMCLMAADIAHSHRTRGGDVHPDTKVWAALPAPWEVVRGSKECTRELIETACVMYNVPVHNWLSAKRDREPVPFKPTPELVHGVAVTSPALAAILRKAGVFSGKGVCAPVPVDMHVNRDEHGFALLAEGSGV
jgi:hypothetical protein